MHDELARLDEELGEKLAEQQHHRECLRKLDADIAVLNEASKAARRLRAATYGLPSELVSSARKRLGLPLAEVAHAVGAPLAELAMVESGEKMALDVFAIGTLADVLQIDRGTLFGSFGYFPQAETP